MCIRDSHGEIEFTTLTEAEKKLDDTKRARFPGCPLYLTMNPQVKQKMLEALTIGDEATMLSTFHSSRTKSKSHPRIKNTDHPYYLLANQAEQATRDPNRMWQQLHTDATNETKLNGYLKEYRVLNPAELIARHSDRITNNGLGLINDYPITLPVSCLLYTSPSPRDLSTSRMPSSA